MRRHGRWVSQLQSPFVPSLSKHLLMQCKLCKLATLPPLPAGACPREGGGATLSHERRGTVLRGNANESDVLQIRRCLNPFGRSGLRRYFAVCWRTAKIPQGCASYNNYWCGLPAIYALKSPWILDFGFRANEYRRTFPLGHVHVQSAFGAPPEDIVGHARPFFFHAEINFAFGQ